MPQVVHFHPFFHLQMDLVNFKVKSPNFAVDWGGGVEGLKNIFIPD